MRHVRGPTISLVLLCAMSCGGDASGPGGGCGGLHDGALTPAARLIADQIVSVFENDTPTLQYAFAEDIGDGRGITAGRAGFTSATGDMLDVVERYALQHPASPLVSYLPRLRELAAQHDGSTTGLDGLVAAWTTAATDPAFRQVQDAVVDEEYYLPAVEQGAELGITCPLTLLAIYDTNIQHGAGDDPDGVPAIISRAVAQSGSPANGADEKTWLTTFFQIRRSVLLNPANAATRDAWAESVVRVDALASIAAAGNYALAPPIVISPYGGEHTIR